MPIATGMKCPEIDLGDLGFIHDAFDFSDAVLSPAHADSQHFHQAAQQCFKCSEASGAADKTVG